MINVLQFGLSENQGGIETYLYKIWKHIDHNEFCFHFLDLTPNGKHPCFYEEFSADNCAFHKVVPRNVSAAQNAADVKRLFRENRFDILHFNVNTLSYILPIEEATKAGCKVLIHSRNAGSARTRRLTRALHEVNKLRVQNMDVTRIAVSQMAGEWLFGKSAFEVYHNGVDTDRFTYTQENREAIRASLGCSEKKVIANVGAFLPAKNHRFMVDTFKEFLKLEPNAVLWFIGDGPGRAEIEALVRSRALEDKVFFLGVRQDMPELYAGMDLFWLPSLFEGYPNVLLEAQCEGVPCLLSDCIPQDARILDNTFCYSLQEPSSMWAQKIEEALNAQIKDRAACNIEMSRRGVSVKSEIEKLENLYKRMLTEP